MAKHAADLKEAVNEVVQTAADVISRSEDITNYVSDLQMKDELNALSTELTFSYFKSPWDRYVKDLAIEPGMTVTLCNNDQILFTGRVVSVTTDGQVTCYEDGWYLSKSQIVYQALNAKPSDVIKDVLKKTGVNAGWIADMPGTISKAWVGSAPSEIIKDCVDAAEQAGSHKYQYFSRCGRFYVRDMPYWKIWPTYKPASNVAEFPITWALESASGTDSIDGMANAIAVVGQGNNAVYTGAIAKNSTSIMKYGLIEKVLTQNSDPGDAALKTLAETELKDSDQLQASRSATLWGSDMVMSGEVMEFHSEKWNLVGDYRVKSVTHKYERSGHLMDVELVNVTPVRSTAGADDTKVYGLPDDLGQSQTSETDGYSEGDDGYVADSGANGDARDRLLKVALSQVGVAGKNPYAKYGFGSPGIQWCAVFVSFCANRAGISTSLIPKSTSSQSYRSKAQSVGKWHPAGSYVPRKGDIVVWTKRGDSGHGHVGIVEDANHTVEGNTGKGVVKRRSWSGGIKALDSSRYLNGFYSWWE